jgi:hypothetical protein
LTHWGYGLVIVVVALAVSPVGWRKAGRLATMLIVLGLVYAFHSYHAL